MNTLIFLEFVYNHMSYQVLKYASPLDEIFLKCKFYILFVLLVPFKMNSDKTFEFSRHYGGIYVHCAAIGPKLDKNYPDSTGFLQKSNSYSICSTQDHKDWGS